MSNITLQGFKDDDPEAGNISLLRNGSNEIVGITVSTVDCNGNNIQTTLSTAETLLVDALGIGVIVITAIEDKTSWYYFEVGAVFFIFKKSTFKSLTRVKVDP